MPSRVPVVVDTGTFGGHGGMEVTIAVTEGGQSLTNRTERDRRMRPALLTTLAFAGFGLVQLFVNVTSLLDERRSLGQPVEPWQPWIWETTSYVVWMALLPVIFWITRRAGSRLTPLWQVVAHLIATVPISLLHSSAMFGLRLAAYAAFDDRYRLSGPMGEVLLYEYRKDVVTYAVIVATLLLLSRLTAQPASAPEPEGEARIEVRDGSRTFFLKPTDLQWVGAAGNYVELHGDSATWLIRRTMANMVTELEPLGFVQIHRSRLVRRDLIAKIQTRQSGDFEVTLRSGAVVGGSRRFRGNLG